MNDTTSAVVGVYDHEQAVRARALKDARGVLGQSTGFLSSTIGSTSIEQLIEAAEYIIGAKLEPKPTFEDLVFGDPVPDIAAAIGAEINSPFDLTPKGRLAAKREARRLAKEAEKC